MHGWGLSVCPELARKRGQRSGGRGERGPKRLWSRDSSGLTELPPRRGEPDLPLRGWRAPEGGQAPLWLLPLRRQHAGKENRKHQTPWKHTNPGALLRLHEQPAVLKRVESPGFSDPEPRSSLHSDPVLSVSVPPSLSPTVTCPCPWEELAPPNRCWSSLSGTDPGLEAPAPFPASADPVSRSLQPVSGPSLCSVPLPLASEAAQCTAAAGSQPQRDDEGGGAGRQLVQTLTLYSQQEGQHLPQQDSGPGRKEKGRTCSGLRAV